ncbi:exodeoxyribonuclease III [Kineosporia sp. R_H_3]|uniref:exodeoxyribonuclease III n=1 Tax=Kineosporia sp. R_H_3 TaxID=1961848 RepID=UPI000B4BAA26|nr:exodeoxyribonuclease III [Kineosporia sp. R_H_3]
MLTIATANVNGVRAAVRRGMGPWLTGRAPDLLALQEVRAPDDALVEALGEGWHVVHEEAAAKGRAGVAVAGRRPFEAVRVGLAPAGVDASAYDHSGRWVEADVALDAASSGAGLLTVVSTYVHTGEAGTPRQVEKLAFLDAVLARMTELAADGRHVVVMGDLNVAHREADLKNWKGNLKKSGFLPEERAWFDRLLGELGWVDVVRAAAGEGPGPYTWWSWRGQAFDTDAGWRIDYQIASAGLAARAVKAEVDRAHTYAARWSDHAPVVVEYDVHAR